jgi:hypothetical protein
MPANGPAIIHREAVLLIIPFAVGPPSWVRACPLGSRWSTPRPGSGASPTGGAPKIGRLLQVEASVNLASVTYGGDRDDAGTVIH